MYGAPYPQFPAAGAPAAPAGRPGVMFGAVAAVFVTILCCLLETAFELLIYQSFGQAVQRMDTTGTGQGISQLQPWLVMTVGGNAIIALALGVGVALLFRRNNVGRIVIWAAGGVCVLVRLCCLSGVGMFGMVNEMVQSESQQVPESGLTEFAPSWQVWSAVGISSVALIAIVVAMVLIGLGPVNRYFRRRRPPAPYGGWGY